MLDLCAPGLYLFENPATHWLRHNSLDKKTPPKAGFFSTSISQSSLRLPRLQSTRDFDAIKTFNLIINLDVVVLLDCDAAFHAVAHVVDQIFEAA